MQETVALIAAALRGDAMASPPAGVIPALVETATAHGVAPLLSACAAGAQWSDAARVPLRAARLREAALALGRDRELCRLLEYCSRAAVDPLLIKGAHLARAVYPSPDLRPHSDVDLLIAPPRRAAAEQALRAAGYRRLAHVTGDVAFTQVHYWRDDASGMRHAVDLHWRICGPRVLRDRLSWEEMHDARTPIAGLGGAAAGPCAAHALAIAALHRTAHHANSDRLIWLYDIHLLAGRLSAAEWESLAALGVDRRMAPILSSALDAASRWLGTDVPAAARRRLAEGASAADPAMLAFLQPGRGPLDTLRSDWRALEGWRERRRFLGEHLLPEPAYMAQRYRTSSRLALPILYVHRLLTAWRRWL